MIRSARNQSTSRRSPLKWPGSPPNSLEFALAPAAAAAPPPPPLLLLLPPPPLPPPLVEERFPVAARVEEDDCCRDMGGRGCGDCAGVFNVKLTTVVGKFVVTWIGVCHITRSNWSTIVEGEEGVLGDSPTGTKVW